MLAMFSSYFNYNVEEFDDLTPLQAYMMLEVKNEMIENEFTFFEMQYRAMNWYVIKAAGAKQFSNPKDLYPVRAEIEIEDRPKVKKEFNQNEPWAQKALAHLLSKN